VSRDHTSLGVCEKWTDLESDDVSIMGSSADSSVLGRSERRSARLVRRGLLELR